MKRSQIARRTPLRRGGPLRQQSAKRRAANAVRRRELLAAFGTDPLCARCGQPADDAHELKRRSQGGSITDAAGIVPLCRDCHTWVSEHAVEAHAEGLHRWSWEDVA